MKTMKQQGFTLIELVMVIVILGILAATALPKFANMQKDARISAIKGAAGAINSASAISHSQYLLTPTPAITLEGASVAIVEGYPAAAAGGINNAVTLSADFGTWSYTTATPPTAKVGFATAVSNCEVVYTEATTTTPASAVATTSGC